jgi:hypothetical protein
LAPVFVVALTIGGCEVRKAYYDEQVRQLCAKDGGVKVVEQIRIPRALANQLPRAGGRIGISPENLAAATEPAFVRIDRTDVLQGDLAITRYEQRVIRRIDGHVVARVVSYTRAGGDFPSFAFPSSFSCPSQAILLDGMQGIYLVAEEAK